MNPLEIFDLGKVIGGPGEGDGPIGAILNMFSGLAILGGGAAAASGLGGDAAATAGVFTDVGGMAARGGMAEGLFGRILGIFANTDLIFDYLIYRDIKGRHGGFHGAANMGEAGETLTDITSSHSFFRSQLEKYFGTSVEGSAEKSLLNEYRALGLNLPGEKLRKAAYKKLAMLLHPDGHKNPEENKIFDDLTKILTGSNASLGNESKRAEYEEALQNERVKVQSLFEKFTEKFAKTDWKTFSEKASQAAAQGPRLALAGPAVAAGAAGAAGKWFSKLTPNQRTGVVFAGVAVAAIGVYWTAKVIDSHRKKRHNFEEQIPLSHTQRLATESAGMDSAHSNSR